MISQDQHIRRGSRRWATRLAEVISWTAMGLLLWLIRIGDLPAPAYRRAVVLIALLAVWSLVFFHLIAARRRKLPGAPQLSLVAGVGLVLALYASLRGHIPSAQMIFIPAMLVTGLAGNFVSVLLVTVVSIAAYWGFGGVADGPPQLVRGAVNSGIFVLSGLVAGLLARELRSHYRAEQEEHRRATEARHRLMNVLDSVDEAIIFRNTQGIVRVLNRRAGELFDLDPEDFLGGPAAEILRAIARRTEDPEGFMESWQDLRVNPELDLKEEIEQIIPERRLLRLYSRPARDESGAVIGRIDVYTDISEGVKRAAEIQRLYTEAREVAESYQRGLLPEGTPRLPRVSMVAHYVPAAGRRAVCGDFYDFVGLDDGRVCLVLGDVCGIGPRAANDAALTRYTLRSFTTSESEPARLLEKMNDYICRYALPERFVRLLVCVLDPERASLTYANAGHVPPVVYRAETESVDWLGQAGVALGVESDTVFRAGHIKLDPGDMLVLYTDGVTEASRNGRPLGQGRLTDLVREYGVGTPGEMVQALRRAVDMWTSPEGLHDDLAIVVCQVIPDTMVGDPVRELLVPNEAARIAEARSFVAGFLADIRASVDFSSEILLAVGEAVSNAVLHGSRSDRRTEVRVRCALEEDHIVITVTDDGSGFRMEDGESFRLPDRFASGGRGLFLMRQLMDNVEIEPSGNGTTVKLSRRLQRAPAE